MDAEKKPLDLMPFCGTEESRPYLHKPFNRPDGFTYATNGHICVRVPKRDGHENGTTDAGAVFPKQIPEMTPSKMALPKPVFENCDVCDGSGRVHTCPTCMCECSACDASGEVEKDTRAILRGAQFKPAYLRLIANLPNLELPVSTPPDRGMYFRFSGGDGVLMPMKPGRDTFAAEKTSK